MSRRSGQSSSGQRMAAKIVTSRPISVRYWRYGMSSGKRFCEALADDRADREHGEGRQERDQRQRHGQELRAPALARAERAERAPARERDDGEPRRAAHALVARVAGVLEARAHAIAPMTASSSVRSPGSSARRLTPRLGAGVAHGVGQVGGVAVHGRASPPRRPRRAGRAPSSAARSAARSPTRARAARCRPRGRAGRRAALRARRGRRAARPRRRTCARRPRARATRTARGCRGRARAAARARSISSRPCGSRPFVGSSSTTSSGACTSACASLTRWRMPVENVPIRREPLLLEPDLEEHLARAQHRGAPRQPAQLAEVHDEVARRHPARQALVLGHVADAAPQLEAARGGVDAEQPRRAGVGLDEAEQRPHERRLAGAVGAQQADRGVARARG